MKSRRPRGDRLHSGSIGYNAKIRSIRCARSRAASPAVGHFYRHRGPVSPVMRGGVTLQFTLDRAAMAAEFCRDLRRRAALLAQGRNHVSFFRG